MKYFLARQNDALVHREGLKGFAGNRDYIVLKSVLSAC